MQIYRRNQTNTADTFPGWIKTDASIGSAWEIVPPINAGAAANEFNGLSVRSMANTSALDSASMLIGLQTVNSNGSGPNLILKENGNVGIGYNAALGATIQNFPQSQLHLEAVGGNQIILGSGAETNVTRLYLSSPSTSNSGVIMAVGSGNNALVTSAASIFNGFKLAYSDSGAVMTLSSNSGSTTTSTPPNLTFYRADGTTLFSRTVCIDTSNYFRMYSAAYNSSSTGTNLSIEFFGSNGSARIGPDTTLNGTAGSLVIGSHLKLNDAALGRATNRPFNNGTAVNGGLLRYNDDNKSVEVYDGSVWADVGYYAGTPLGSIIAYPSNTAPSDSFLLCDGTAVSRSTYVDLYNLFLLTPNGMSTYGAGDGSTTFNLPNIKGRTIVGLDGGDASFNPLGRTGGAKTHTLQIGEIPSHSHSVPSLSVQSQVTATVTSGQIQFKGTTGTTDICGNHTHTVSVTQGSSKQNQWGPGVQNVDTFGQATTSLAGAHVHKFLPEGQISYSNLVSQGTATGTATGVDAGGSTGGSGSHNNLQPYIVLYYFIKVLKESKQYKGSVLTSDIRVKRNITPVCSEQAINAIRLLQPKRYEYIDKNLSEFKQHIGFIAQEVKICIPESVHTKREYIPNIYSIAKLTTTTTKSLHGKNNGNSVLTSVQHPITKLIQEQLMITKTDLNLLDARSTLSINGVKLKMFNRSKECFHVCCVDYIDDYNLLIEPLDAVTTTKLLSADYFVYGQEIEDYHYMNNDAIFSTLVAAFHSLDAKCRRQEEMIERINLKLSLYKPGDN
jgi:microcystin-dependent protein